MTLPATVFRPSFFVCFVTVWALGAADAPTETAVRSSSGPAGRSFLARGSHPQQQKSASLDIYYETLCPDSLKLLSGSFNEFWSNTEISQHFAVRLVPSGNAEVFQEQTISTGYHFWHPETKYPLVLCQHGQPECLGNLIQACAIDLLQTPDKYVPFVICMASYGTQKSVEMSSYECADKLGINIGNIKTCTESEHGHNLLVANAQESDDPNLKRSYVPFIRINGKHAKLDDGKSILEPLCGALAGQKPTACKAFVKVEDEKGHAKKSGGCSEDGGSGEGFF